MIKNHVRLALIVCVAQCGSGCITPAAARREAVVLVKSWNAPPVGTTFRADGEGPFPPPWPVYAAVIQTREQAAYTGPLSNATLLMGASPDPPGRSPAAVAAGVRYAIPCRTAGLAGRWMKLAPQEYAFVLVDDSGGTAGFKVTVIQHGWSYSVEESYQSHSFRPAFQAYSALPVMVGDVDGDDREELLVASRDDSSPAIIPTRYQVYAWDGSTMQHLRDLSVNAVKNMDSLAPVSDHHDQ